MLCGEGKSMGLGGNLTQEASHGQVAFLMGGGVVEEDGGNEIICSFSKMHDPVSKSLFYSTERKKCKQFRFNGEKTDHNWSPLAAFASPQYQLLWWLLF